MKSRIMILTSRDFLVFILVSYAVVVEMFVGAGFRNYLVLFAAVLGGILFVLLRLSLQRQAFWAFTLFSLMAISAFYQSGTGGLGSLALTLVYALGYFAIAGLLARVENKRTFVVSMMRGIIYAFAIVSVIQMITSLAGLPVPNLIASKGLWSHNSLAYEASQLGRVVGISMLCYLMLDRVTELSDQPVESLLVRSKVLVAFLITMLLSGSSLAFLAIVLVFGLSRSLVSIILIGAISLLIWPAVLMIDYEPLNRAINLLTSLGSLDLGQVLKAEHSGGVRIAPLLIYLKEASTAEPSFWFGYGSQGIAQFFQDKILGVRSVGAPFMPGFAVIYGAVPTALLIWLFAIRKANRTTLPLVVFWAIFMWTSAWNTQVFWYGLIVIQLAGAASREAQPTREIMQS